MIDFSKYPTKTLLNILRATPKYKEAISTKESWGDVMGVIKLLDIKYTNEQLQYVKENDWDKK